MQDGLGSMIDQVRLYDLIKESFLLLDFGDRQFLEQYALTVPRYYALVHIAVSPGLSPSLLSRAMFCDKSNITRLVQGLVADGLVERRPHDHDGRVQRLYLTAAGAALQAIVAEAHHRYVQRRLSVLAECETEDTLTTLSHLNRALHEELDNSPILLLN